MIPVSAPLIASLLFSTTLLQAETDDSTNAEAKEPTVSRTHMVFKVIRGESNNRNSIDQLGNEGVLFWMIRELPLSDWQKMEIEKTRIEMRYALKSAIKNPVPSAPTSEYLHSFEKRGFNEEQFIDNQIATYRKIAEVQGRYIGKMIGFLNDDQYQTLYQKIHTETPPSIPQEP